MPETKYGNNDVTKKPKELFISFLLIVLISAYPSYYIFAQNALEVTLLETLIPAGLSIFIGLAFFCLALIIFKKTYFSVLISAVLIFFFLNFGMFRQAAASISFFNKHEIWGGILLAAIIMALLVFLLLKANKKEDTIKKLTLVVTIVFAGLFIFNTITALPSVIKRTNADEESDNLNETVALNYNGNLPNIYYFILDEYGSFECLDKYYGYKNDEFHNFLTSNKFSISETSSNRSTNTKFCLAENFNLDYVCNDTMINADYLRLINKAKWFEIMNELGYSQHSFSTQLDMFPIADLDNDEAAKGFLQKFQSIFTGNTEGGENIFTLSYKNTFLFSVFGSDFLEAPTADGIPVDRVGRVQWVFDKYESFGINDVEESHITISYICSPHVPFAFDENGKSQLEEEKYNWSDPQYYLGQLQYVTKRMETALSNIIKYDPSAIIIVQSDHGFRNHHDDKDEKVNMPFKMASSDAKKILNAVYYAGEKVEIEGLSGPDTLRAILTKMGLDYPPLS